ncbi:hypothetical protein CKA32_000686 [Geitlerinema sp. FC II]|nr:hypothetical protein CKA32_000686 [Geitlerinema sp. FC II]
MGFSTWQSPAPTRTGETSFQSLEGIFGFFNSPKIPTGKAKHSFNP